MASYIRLLLSHSLCACLSGRLYGCFSLSLGWEFCIVTTLPSSTSLLLRKLVTKAVMLHSYSALKPKWLHQRIPVRSSQLVTFLLSLLLVLWLFLKRITSSVIQNKWKIKWVSTAAGFCGSVENVSWLMYQWNCGFLQVWQKLNECL